MLQATHNLLTSSMRMAAVACALLFFAACTSDGSTGCTIDCGSAGNPIAVDAGESFVATEMDIVRLSGSATHAEDLPLSYLWEQIDGPAVNIQGINLPDASFVAPFLSTDFETFVFELTATSADGASNSDRVSVTIQLSGA